MEDIQREIELPFLGVLENGSWTSLFEGPLHLLKSRTV